MVLNSGTFTSNNFKKKYRIYVMNKVNEPINELKTLVNLPVSISDIFRVVTITELYTKRAIIL